LSSLLATLFEGAQQGSRIAIIEVHEPRTTLLHTGRPRRRPVVGRFVRRAGGVDHQEPNPPQYKVEIEPKLNLGFVGLWDYGGNSYGPGVRFSIPVMSPGFVKTINDSVAITFGADFVYYEGYRYYNRYCGGNRACYDYYRGYNSGFWSVQLPVALQWNFFLTDKWSVFGEAGLTVRHAFYRDDPLRQHVLRRALLRLQPEPLERVGHVLRRRPLPLQRKDRAHDAHRLPDRGLGRRVVLPISRQSTVDSRQSCLLTVDC